MFSCLLRDYILVQKGFKSNASHTEKKAKRVVTTFNTKSEIHNLYGYSLYNVCISLEV
jgi:hypothetical protein